MPVSCAAAIIAHRDVVLCFKSRNEVLDFHTISICNSNSRSKLVVHDICIILQVNVPQVTCFCLSAALPFHQNSSVDFDFFSSICFCIHRSSKGTQFYSLSGISIEWYYICLLCLANILLKHVSQKTTPATRFLWLPPLYQYLLWVLWTSPPNYFQRTNPHFKYIQLYI